MCSSTGCKRGNADNKEKRYSKDGKNMFHHERRKSVIDRNLVKTEILMSESALAKMTRNRAREHV